MEGERLLLFVEPLVMKNFWRYPVDGLDDGILGLSDVDLSHMRHLHHIRCHLDLTFFLHFHSVRPSKRLSMGPREVALEAAAWLTGSAEDSVRSLSCRKSERHQQSDLQGVLCHQVLTVSQCSCDGAKQTTGQRWQTDDYLLLRIFCVTKQTVGSAGVDRASGREQLLQVGVHWCACWRLWCPAQGILTTSRSLNTNISPLKDFTAWWKQIQDGHILAHQHSTWTMSNWTCYWWVARCHPLNAFS